MPDEPRPRTPISADWVLKRIQEGKNVQLKNAVIEGDLDLSKLNLTSQHRNCIFQKDFGLKADINIVQSSIQIGNSSIKGNMNFSNTIFNATITFFGTTFNKTACFNGTIFKKFAGFDYTTFNEDADFIYATFNMVGFLNSTTFNKRARFYYATFEGGAGFNYATFKEGAGFLYATSKEPIEFNNANFGANAAFQHAIFKGIMFDYAIFKENIWFYNTEFGGDVLTFRDATFLLSKSQEEACRRAKNVLAKAGNREEEEYHFYREMEAKRKQKGIYDTINSPSKAYSTLRAENLIVIWRLLWYDFIEHIFIQKMFGYGVHPKRLMISWAAIVLAFGMLYWYGKGLTGVQDWLDYFKVSFATAIAPGYIAAIINPGSGGYRLVPAYHFAAMVETIVGTFLWAGFIATFAKKYMR